MLFWPFLDTDTVGISVENKSDYFRKDMSRRSKEKCPYILSSNPLTPAGNAAYAVYRNYIIKNNCEVIKRWMNINYYYCYISICL